MVCFVVRNVNFIERSDLSLTLFLLVYMEVDEKYNDLLNLFNKKDRFAVGEVYLKYHKELIIYASSLYRGTEVSAEDVVHDVFVNICNLRSDFTTLESVKAYAYVSIKNKFKNYISHNKHIEAYVEKVQNDEDYDIDVLESELYSFAYEALKVLPKLHADVLKLYIDGWKLPDIAVELDKTENHIYKIKHDAIQILKKKISKCNISILLLLIG